ncbi:MAG: DUF6382 domain-containing protein [Candidatus Pristimantibacillus sp.]
MSLYIIDFSMNRGHEMIIDREQGIRREELDNIELQMLQGSRIPHMLPIEWFELDGLITFRYDLTGRKMLSHRLQLQRLTMEQFYTMLLGVVEALDECKHYMLRPEGCLLEDQYLFVGEQLSDINVAYIPLKEDNNEKARFSGSGNLLSLVVRWTAYIHSIDGEGLQRVLQHLDGNHLPLRELRATLLELIGTISNTTSSSNSNSRTSNSSPDNQSSSIQEKASPLEERREPKKAENVWDTNIQLSLRTDDHHEEPDYNFDELEEQGTKRGPWIITAVIVIAIACVWRYMYLSSPTRVSLYISLALTLMGIAALLFIWMRGSSPSLLVQDEENVRVNSEEFMPESQLLSSPVRARTNAAMSTNIQKNFSFSKPQTVLAENEEKDRAPQPIEATVLLGQTEGKLSMQSGVSLHREWSGNDEQLDWKGERFTIGRSGEQVTYGEDAQGISRMHLEIERVNGNYHAKDLGSRNGSMLNGQTMIPYKSYSFITGDIIQLAGSSGPKYGLKQRS